jgi:hypothetical protein
MMCFIYSAEIIPTPQFENSCVAEGSNPSFCLPMVTCSLLTPDGARSPQGRSTHLFSSLFINNFTQLTFPDKTEKAQATARRFQVAVCLVSAIMCLYLDI